MTMSKRAQDEVYFTPQQIEWPRFTEVSRSPRARNQLRMVPINYV